LEDRAAQGRLDEAGQLVGELETMSRELVCLAAGVSLETLRRMTKAPDDLNRTDKP
jgi:hypothetical protein